MNLFEDARGILVTFSGIFVVSFLSYDSTVSAIDDQPVGSRAKISASMSPLRYRSKWPSVSDRPAGGDPPPGGSWEVLVRAKLLQRHAQLQVSYRCCSAVNSKKGCTELGGGPLRKRASSFMFPGRGSRKGRKNGSE